MQKQQSMKYTRKVKDMVNVVAWISAFMIFVRLDSDGGPPLSLIRLVSDCHVQSTALCHVEGQWVTAASCAQLGTGWTETQDVSQIEEPNNKNLRNTDIFKVIISNCTNYCHLAGPHGGAVQLEKLWIRLVPWQSRAGDMHDCDTHMNAQA